MRPTIYGNNNNFMMYDRNLAPNLITELQQLRKKQKRSPKLVRLQNKTFF